MTTVTSRRNALKILGLGGLTTAIAPAVLLQACKEAASTAAEKTYSFLTLNADQAATLKLIQDAIIPRTDTPSASDVGSVEFFDTYVTHGYEPKDRARVLYQLDRFAAKVKEQGVELADATDTHVGALMSAFFVDYVAPEEDADTKIEIEGNTIDASAEGAEGEEPMVEYGEDPEELNALLTGIRWITMESYFQSEEIGENVLNYDEVPGKYIGQMPMSELPRPGMSWSL